MGAAGQHRPHLGSSFLFIDVGLEALAPGVIALSRVALGVAALSLVPAARRPIGPEDPVRVLRTGAAFVLMTTLVGPAPAWWSPAHG